VTPQNINTGFYVTPRVNGDTVFLDISTQRDTPGQFGPGSANTNRIATTVSGKLGSWIDLGGIDQSQSSESRGILSRERGSSAVARGVQVRVEEAR
jgi:type II secretory pathway component HofQ